MAINDLYVDTIGKSYMYSKLGGIYGLERPLC